MAVPPSGRTIQFLYRSYHEGNADLSIPAGTALAQAEQVEPSRGQIPADCALDSVPAGTALAQAEQIKPSRGQIPADCALFSVS